MNTKKDSPFLRTTSLNHINYDRVSAGLHIVTMNSPKVILTPIVRTKQEYFSDTVAHAQKLAGFHVCINGGWFENETHGSLAHALNKFHTTSPLPAATTTTQGQALQSNGVISGRTSPDLFSISQKLDRTWIIKQGDVDPSCYTGIGGLGALVHNGLRHGVENLYSQPRKEARLIGMPRSEDMPFLIQRNDLKISGLSARSPATGKCGFGILNNGGVIVMVEAHGEGTMTIEEFRDEFIKRGCRNAFACDGSDSALLMFKDGFIINQGVYKNEVTTCGIGFRVED